MKIEKNQSAKDDPSLVRLVLLAESDDDKDLLKDMLDYLEYMQEELEKTKEF